MNGTIICHTILETVRKLVHNCMFLNAYSIGNAFTRIRKLALAIDDTSFQLPQTQRNMETFGVSVNQNSSPCAMASSSSLFDVLNDMIIDARIDSYNYGERKFAQEHLDESECIGLKNDKLILMDRAYPSYEIFQELLRRRLAFVVRLNSTFSSITQRAGADFIVDYKSRGYKEPVKLRIVRIVFDDGTVETLATSLEVF